MLVKSTNIKMLIDLTNISKMPQPESCPCILGQDIYSLYTQEYTWVLADCSDSLAQCW